MGALRKPAAADRRGLYAAIETGCARLDIDESVKRDMFFAITRKRSKTEMDEYQLRQVLQHLRDTGFREKHPAPKTKMTQAQYIRQLWARLAEKGKVEDPSDRALRAWLEAQTRAPNGGLGISDPTMLTSSLARSIIERLKKWVGRA